MAFRRFFVEREGPLVLEVYCISMWRYVITEDGAGTLGRGLTLTETTVTFGGRRMAEFRGRRALRKFYRLWLRDQEVRGSAEVGDRYKETNRETH